MMPIRSRSLSVLVIALVLAGCASPQPSPNDPPGARGDAGDRAFRNTGTVTAIDFVAAQFRDVARTGVITGEVVGGVPDDRRDEHRDRTPLPVAGAVGPALTGSPIAGRPEASPGVYRVTVQYDSGGSQIIEVFDTGNLRVKDRVTVDGNRIRRD